MIRAAALALALAAPIFPAMASEGSLSLRDSFRIGTRGALCSAQTRSVGPNLVGMFDREYWVVCQGSAAPIGRLYALRKGKDDPVARVDKNRDPQLGCAAATMVRLGDLERVLQRECGPAHRSYAYARGNIVYIADGRSDHDDALRLGLRTIVADAPIEGEVKLAAEAGDPTAFFRSQAETLDENSVRAEAWRRAAAGCLAEAREFNKLLAERGTPSGLSRAEELANQAMLQSDQGDFEAAESSFVAASMQNVVTDPQMGQWLRNQRARHYLNHGRADKAIELLSDRFVEPSPQPSAEERSIGVELSEIVARDLNRDGPSAADHAAWLDSERLFLLGVAHRLREDFPAARASFAHAEKRLEVLRESRPASGSGPYAMDGLQPVNPARDRRILYVQIGLRANIKSQLAQIAEAEGDLGQAGKLYSDVIDAADEQFPNAAQTLLVKLRYADILTGQGKEEEAGKLRQEIKTAAGKLPCVDPRLKGLFELLATPPVAYPAPLAAGALPVPGIGRTAPAVNIESDNNN